LTFTEGAGSSINVSGISEIGSAVNATLENVDYIMVRDDALSSLPLGSTMSTFGLRLELRMLTFTETCHISTVHM
jgi:hypothetical protein